MALESAGVVEGDRVTGHFDAARETLAAVEDLGISLAEVTDALEHDGVEKFVQSWRELLETVATAMEGSPMSLSVAITEPLNQGIRSRCEERAQEGFIESLSKADSTLWGESAQAEASIRLGWTADPRMWSDLASEVAEVHRDLMARGINRLVLCGMGGSSLGPEVIAATHDLPLTIVDSTHPDEVSHSVNQDLSATVVVVSSKSGGTVETDSQKRAFEGALRSQGLDPAGHMVVVSDPGSPLSISSLEAGYRVFDGDPTIGGRFSVLSPFGLVPAGLAGLDLAQFLGGRV